MINRICILLFFALNLFNLNINSYNNFENEISNITKFKENGVKLEYKTNKLIKEEKERVLRNLDKEFKIVTEDENNVKLVGRINIDLSLWEENEKTYVSIVVINLNPEYSTLSIKKELMKLTNYFSKDIKCFQYYKGALTNDIDTNFIDKLKEETDILKIENGYTGKIKLEKEIVNFGLVNYDTGVQLIIGTPIIFTTY